MDAVMPVVLIFAGLYVGWNIGANDAANCIGTTVGAQIISYRKAWKAFHPDGRIIE